MPRQQESLASDLEKATERLKQAASLLVTRQEPMRVMQMLKWDVLMLRAEITALRDMMNDRGGLSLNEYQKRFKDRIDCFTGMIEQQLAVAILDDGTTIEGVKSARHHKTRENA